MTEPEKLIVHIRNNATGEVRQQTEEGPWEYGSDYLWADGNLACDCNRYLIVESAGPAQEPEDDYDACGHERYTVWIRSPRGALLYFDDDAPISDEEREAFVPLEDPTPQPTSFLVLEEGPMVDDGQGWLYATVPVQSQTDYYVAVDWRSGDAVVQLLEPIFDTPEPSDDGAKGASDDHDA